MPQNVETISMELKEKKRPVHNSTQITRMTMIKVSTKLTLRPLFNERTKKLQGLNNWAANSHRNTFFFQFFFLHGMINVMTMFVLICCNVLVFN